MPLRRLDTKKVIEYFRTEDLELADLVLQVCKGAVVGRQREEDDKVIAESERPSRPSPAARAMIVAAKISQPKVPKVVKKRTRRTKAQIAAATVTGAASVTVSPTNGAAIKSQQEAE